MKRSILALLLALPMLSLAQSNLKKGYVVTNSGDTLRGFMKLKERNLNPKECNFWARLNDHPQVFTIKDCKGFSVEGFEQFSRARVRISLSSDQLGNLTSGIDTTSKVDTVFLKVLTVGKSASLFSYTDHIKQRFYLQDKNSNIPYELINNIYRHASNGQLIVNDPVYIKQLAKLIDENQVQAEVGNIARLKYKENELVKVVYGINQITFKESKLKATRLFAGIGLNVSKGYYKGDYDLANDAAVSKSSYFPMLNAGIDLFANPNTKKLVYRVELALLMSKNDISVHTNEEYKAVLTHKFNQFTVALTPQVLYNFYNSDALKIFGALGASLNFSSYSNNVSTRTNSIRNETYTMPDAVKIESFNFAPKVTAGVVLNNRIELSAGYSLPSIISSFAAYNLYMKRYSLGIHYFF